VAIRVLILFITDEDSSDSSSMVSLKNLELNDNKETSIQVLIISIFKFKERLEWINLRRSR
jgi:hypothetical protein